MKTIDQLKVGDVVFTKSRHTTNVRQGVVKSIGRVWITLENGEKFRVSTMCDKDNWCELILDIDQWKVQRDEKAEYGDKLARIKNRLQYANAKTVTLDQLRQVAEILGVAGVRGSEGAA